MAKVYVVQEPHRRDPDTGERKKMDMRPALKFGSLEVLLPLSEQMSVLNAAQLTRTLKGKLSMYSDEDFILAAGDPVAIGAACAIAASVNRGRFTVLKWDNFDHCYYPVPINVKGAL